MNKCVLPGFSFIYQGRHIIHDYISCKSKIMYTYIHPRPTPSTYNLILSSIFHRQYVTHVSYKLEVFYLEDKRLQITFFFFYSEKYYVCECGVFHAYQRTGIY